MVDYSFYVDYLIKSGLPVLFGGGEYDMRDGAKAQDAWMKKTLKNLPDEFWQGGRELYYFGEQKIGGQYRQYNNFTFITIPKSGHCAPGDNYDAFKAYLDDYISQGSLKCHHNNCSVSDKMCSFMQQCGEGGEGW